MFTDRQYTLSFKKKMLINGLSEYNVFEGDYIELSDATIIFDFHELQKKYKFKITQIELHGASQIGYKCHICIKCHKALFMTIFSEFLDKRSEYINTVTIESRFKTLLG